MFELTAQELTDVRCQFGTSSANLTAATTLELAPQIS